MSKSRYPLDPDSDGNTACELVDCDHRLRLDEAGKLHMGYRLCWSCAEALFKSMLEHNLAEAERQLKELGE